jgi:biotin operon repressor
VRRKRLPQSRSAVVPAALDYLWSHRQAWVPGQELARALGVADRTVRRAIAVLRSSGVTIEASWEGYRLLDLPRGTLVACARCGRALGRPHTGIAGRWICAHCGYVDEAEERAWAPLVLLPGSRSCRECGGPIGSVDPRAVYCSITCSAAATSRRRRRGGAENGPDSVPRLRRGRHR